MGGVIDSLFGGGGQKAANKSAEYTKEMYEQGKDALSPYYTQGGDAMGMMGAMLGLGGTDAQKAGFQNFMDSTGYQFLMDSGSKAVTGNMAAKGLLKSGATLKALTNFGQNLASTKTAEMMGMLSNMAGIGAGAAGNLAGAGANAAQGYSNAKMAGAQSKQDAWGSVFNLGLGLAGLSDERAKGPLTPVGKLASGLTLFVYRYLDGGPLQWGVSAQEVARERPEALGPVNDNGFQTVNYARV